MWFIRKLFQRSGSLSVHDWLVRGAGHSQKGEYERAIQAYTEAIRLDPNHAVCYIFRGLAYESRGGGTGSDNEDWTRAAADYTEAIRLAPIDSWGYEFRGSLSVREGEFDKALADLAKAIELDPTSKKAYAIRAAAHALLGDEASALRDKRMVQELTLLPLPSADSYVKRALASSEAGRHDLAIVDLTEAIKLDPKHAMAYSFRCGSYVELGCLERALADQVEAVRLEPGNELFRLKLNGLRGIRK